MFRVGIGYDSHRFEAGRRLFLGGVEFPNEVGLKGHSDADVLLHAIIDALLGACGEGDIGAHFPDTDPQWKGANSLELLKAVSVIVRDKGFVVGNIDANVIAERPKLRSMVTKIRETIAGTLGISIEQVSVKGKTNEKMDAVGEGIGIVSNAVVLLVKK